MEELAREIAKKNPEPNNNEKAKLANHPRRGKTDYNLGAINHPLLPEGKSPSE